MAKTYACLLVGVEVVSVEIEAVLGNGFSGLNILGMTAEVSKDMRERIRTALESMGVLIPAKRVTVNISPSEKLKETRTILTQLDFAVAAAILYAIHEDKLQLIYNKLEYFAGELTLKGELKEISNSLIYKSLFLLHKDKNISLSFPYKNKGKDSEYFQQYTFYYNNISEWWKYKTEKKENLVTATVSEYKQNKPDKLIINIAENIFYHEVEHVVKSLIKNPKAAVAILVAAVGKHHILIAGEPGIGKTYSLQKIQKILAPLTENELFEVQIIHSKSEQNQRPFRCPHHSVSAAAMTGGSSLKPGEVSLAHRGVLFLDELAEFSAQSLETLREPMDAKCVYISRANGNIRYPSDFQLCATTNPCTCGFLFSKVRACRCHPREVRKYLQKLSGPLLDRFCLQVWLEPSSAIQASDPFSQTILSLQEFNRFDKFIWNFVEHILLRKKIAEDEYDNEINILIANHQPFQNLSLRGQKKVVKLIYSFKKIFPELEINLEFIENVLNYRILDKMFLQKNLF